MVGVSELKLVGVVSACCRGNVQEVAIASVAGHGSVAIASVAIASVAIASVAIASVAGHGSVAIASVAGHGSVGSEASGRWWRED